MTRIPIHNVGTLGVMADSPAHTLPPEAWTDSRNMRFKNKQAYRAKGHAVVLGTPTVPPGFIFNTATDTSSFWLYANTTDVYVNDAGVHTQITRNAGGTPYTATSARMWQAGLLGGIPVLNNGSDVPQAWLTLSSAVDLSDIAAWVADIPTTRAKIVKPFGSYLMALNLTVAGTRLPHRILWSSRADPGSLPATWNVNDATQDAGQRDFTDADAGQIVDGLMLGNYFVVYKETATHLISQIGGQEIMRLEFLLNSGLLAAKCVCLFDKGRKHFVVSENDIITHAGTKAADSILDEKARDRLFGELNVSAKDGCFAFENARENECLFVYPTLGVDSPNRALVWNYRRNTIGFRDWEGESVDEGNITDATVNLWSTPEGTWADETGPWQTAGGKGIVIGDPAANVFWQFESGDTFGTLAVTAFLEHAQLAIIGKDRQGEPKVDYGVRKIITRIWPKFQGLGANQVQVQIGFQETLEDPISYTIPQTFSPQQRFLDFEVVGRLMAVKFSSSANSAWTCEGYDIDITVVGEN